MKSCDSDITRDQEVVESDVNQDEILLLCDTIELQRDEIKALNENLEITAQKYSEFLEHLNSSRSHITELEDAICMIDNELSARNDALGTIFNILNCCDDDISSDDIIAELCMVMDEEGFFGDNTEGNRNNGRKDRLKYQSHGEADSKLELSESKPSRKSQSSYNNNKKKHNEEVNQKTTTNNTDEDDNISDQLSPSEYEELLDIKEEEILRLKEQIKLLNDAVEKLRSEKEKIEKERKLWEARRNSTQNDSISSASAVEQLLKMPKTLPESPIRVSRDKGNGKDKDVESRIEDSNDRRGNKNASYSLMADSRDDDLARRESNENVRDEDVRISACSRTSCMSNSTESTTSVSKWMKPGLGSNVSSPSRRSIGEVMQSVRRMTATVKTVPVVALSPETIPEADAEVGRDPDRSDRDKQALTVAIPASKINAEESDDDDDDNWRGNHNRNNNSNNSGGVGDRGNNYDRIYGHNYDQNYDRDCNGNLAKAGRRVDTLSPSDDSPNDSPIARRVHDILQRQQQQQQQQQQQRYKNGSGFQYYPTSHTRTQYTDVGIAHSDRYSYSNQTDEEESPTYPVHARAGLRSFKNSSEPIITRPAQAYKFSRPKPQKSSNSGI